MDDVVDGGFVEVIGVVVMVGIVEVDGVIF